MENNRLNKLNINNYDNEVQSIEEKELKFINIISLIKRNKKTIFTISSISSLISILISFNIEKRWSGFFEIIIANEQKNLSELGSIASIIPRNNNLLTEIEILKSPSVLLPVYNFLKEEKTDPNDSSSQKGFGEWFKSNVQVSLKKGTNVLKISYEDKNKENIVPALNLISKTYQEYSLKIKKEDIKNELKFLDQQIKSYSDSSKEAFINLDSFARKYDLNPINPTSGIQYLEDEIIQLRSGNKIRMIDEQLRKLEKSNNDDDFILEIARLLTPNLKIIKELDEIQSEINLLSLTYTEKDYKLSSLKGKKNILALTLKNAVKNNLEAQKRNALITINAAKRPEDITTNYKLMALKTVQEFEVLKELQVKNRKLMQQEDKFEKPWKLIANPYLLEYPISPHKSKIVIVSTIAALISSLILVFLLEKISNIIFNESEIEELLRTKKLITITTKDLKENLLKINLLSTGILSDFKTTNIRIIDVSNSNQNLVKEFFSNFKKQFKSASLITKSSSISQNSKINIFLIKLGETKFKDINQYLINLNLNKDEKNLWIET